MFINQQQTKGMKLTANPAWLSLSPHGGNGSGAKFLRIMKLTTIIILAACLHTSAKGVAQQTITFSGKEVSLESVFTAIKKQTTYRFFFNTDMLTNASKITIDVKNAQIEQVMNMALKDQPLTFTIKGRTIFIMKKPEEVKKSVQVAAPTGDPITVSGRVTDENGEPLAGANVKVKGGTNGVTTDAQGRFTLNNVDPNASLEVSFVGRETEILSVKGKSVFSVALGQKVGTLDETVVIAYGTTSRRLNTGNVSTIKSTEIEKQPVNNPLLALQGRVPGLFITQASGVPGSGVTVRIQGQNSITSGNDPLYVIDGVPYVSQLLSTNIGTILGASPGGANGNPMNYINPNDIESIEVLKDADATAIYGSRAANGAILITTKKGKEGKTKVDINGQKGWGQITRNIDLLNTQQYIQMRREAFKNDNAVIGSRDYDVNGLWDTTRYTDWQKTLIGKTASYTDISARVGGGTAGVNYSIGGTYHKETTVFPGDFSDKKGGIHFSLRSTSNSQKFRIQLSGNYLADNNNLPQLDLTSSALRLAPNAPALYNSDGSLNWMPNNAGTSSSWINPLRGLYNAYKNNTTNLLSNAVLSYQVLPGFEIKSSFGYNSLQTKEFAGFPLIAYAPENRSFLTSSALYTNNNINSWIIEPQAFYRCAIDKGKLELLVGTTILQNNSNGESLLGDGYSNDLILEDIKSATTITAQGSVKSIYKYNAIFGRINYDWLDKYIINITARRDGSSRFGSKNQFHNFASIGGAWIFTSERFIKNNLSFLSFGKMRGSYGTTGNDQIGDYRYLNLYTPINAGVPYQNTSAIEVTALPNPYLQWEKTKKLQFGLDLGFVKDRILLTVNYVRNTSSNQLLSYALPVMTGFPGIISNFPATIQNTAWELSLNVTNIKANHFNWSTNFNLTVPENKLISFPDLATSTYASLLVIGEPITVTKAYHFLGVDQLNGVFQFSDSHGNPTTTPNNLTDKTVLINTLPKFYGGFQNNLKYKGLQLDFLFQFVKQIGSNYLYNYANVPGQFVRGYNNEPVTVLNRWQKAGDVSSIQKVSQNFSLSGSADNFRFSDAVYSDASYIRLKNLSLSWQLPDKWLRMAHLQSSRIYIQGQNLLTITDYQGMDPENMSSTSLPPLRVITLGLQIGF
jgi:TonB-dependent starch-binding outer membrane protein SusC